MIQKQHHISNRLSSDEKEKFKTMMEKIFKATSKDRANMMENKYQNNKNWLKCLAPEQLFQCYVFDKLDKLIKVEKFRGLKMCVLVECRIGGGSKECDLVIFSKETEPDVDEVKKYLRRTARYPQKYAKSIVKSILKNKNNLKPLLALELKWGSVSSAIRQFEKFENDLIRLKNMEPELKYAVLINSDGPDQKLSEKARERKREKIERNLETMTRYSGVKAYYLTTKHSYEFNRDPIDKTINEIMKNEFV